MMLTAASGAIALVAAAGPARSHMTAAFARLWTRRPSGRVIGLTTSTNAAKVLQTEGRTREL